MGIWLAIVAFLLMAGYSAWTAVSSVRDARAERPPQTWAQSLTRDRHGWAATAIVFGFTAVLLAAGVVAVGLSQLPVLLALTGIESYTFPIAIATFAALFFGARILFRRYLGKRWVRELIAIGSVVIGIALVFFAMSFAD